MKANYAALAAALIGCGLLSATVHAQTTPAESAPPATPPAAATPEAAPAAAPVAPTAEAPPAARSSWIPEFRLSGYGTVALTHLNNRNADFLGNTFQSHGVGYTHPWSFDPDTRLGLQADLRFTPKLTGVVQLLSQAHTNHPNNTSSLGQNTPATQNYDPRVEWANLKYQITDNLSVRIGRTAAEQYLYAETRMVSYSNLWVRPPNDVYGVYAATSNDGIDASFRHKLFGGYNTIVAFAGGSNRSAPWGGFHVRDSYGLVNTFEKGSWTVRANYNRYNIDIDLPYWSNFDSAFNALAAFDPSPTVRAEAVSFQNEFRNKNRMNYTLGLGATYDPGNYVITSEWVKYRGAGILNNAHAWYVSGGYRFGNFTPYLVYGQAAGKPPNGQFSAPISVPGIAPLMSILPAINSGFNAKQQTTSLGLRWDAYRNVAVKAQLDRIHPKDGSAGRFTGALGVPASDYRGNLFTLAVDFVF